MNRARAAAIGLAAMAMVTTACAGPASHTATSTQVASAATVYETTVAAESAEFRSTFSVTPADQKGRLLSTETGVFSWSDQQGQIMSRAVDPGSYDITTQQTIDGNTTYSRVVSKSGPLADSFTFGVSSDGWAQSTVAGTSDTEDALLRLIDSGFAGATNAGEIAGDPDAVSPSDILGVLDRDEASTVKVGYETIGGVATTQYEAVVPFRNLGASVAEATEASLLLGISSLPVDYWIDASGRLVQLRMGITVKHSPVGVSPSTVAPYTTSTTVPMDSSSIVAGQGTFKAVGSTSLETPITISLTLTLSDYGANAHFTPPAPSQITSRWSCTVQAGGESCTS